jgi:hypothetical protein
MSVVPAKNNQGKDWLSIKSSSMGFQEESWGLSVTGLAESTSDLIGSRLTLGTRQWIEGRSEAASIQLSIELGEIKIVRELWNSPVEVVRSDSDGGGDVKAGFANGSSSTLSLQKAKEGGEEQERGKNILKDVTKVGLVYVLMFQGVQVNVFGNWGWSGGGKGWGTLWLKRKDVRRECFGEYLYSLWELKSSEGRSVCNVGKRAWRLKEVTYSNCGVEVNEEKAETSDRVNSSKLLQTVKAW